MTGYGRSTTKTASGTVTVELRSTNHRYLELDPRLPEGLNGVQGQLAALLRAGIRRGRVEVFVSVKWDARNQRRVVFDDALLQRYYDALVALKGRFGLKGPVTLEQLLALPQALTVAEIRPQAEQLWAPIRRSAQAALRELVRSRRREGAKLALDIRQQLQAIERHLAAIKRRLPRALDQQRQRLRERLKELLGSDSAKSASQLEQAASILRDADVHEERIRLESHLAYMRETLAAGQLIGKRLDFIAQELMREANTMGSKVNDPDAAQHVVEIKGCIEKIREQVQNLE
jgi:uncharacterized protein (TIGR00255 family)